MVLALTRMPGGVVPVRERVRKAGRLPSPPISGFSSKTPTRSGSVCFVAKERKDRKEVPALFLCVLCVLLRRKTTDENQVPGLWPRLPLETPWPDRYSSATILCLRFRREENDGLSRLQIF